MIQSNEHFLVIISGSVGSGKTTVGHFLKERLARTAVFDMDMIKWQISDFKRGDADNAIVRDAVYSLARTYCMHGINIIIPQTMLPDEPQRFANLAQEFGYTYIHLELYAQDDVVMKRVLEKHKDNPNRPPIERIQRNIAWYKKTTDPTVVVRDTSTMTPEEVGTFALQEITNRIPSTDVA